MFAFVLAALFATRPMFIELTSEPTARTYARQRDRAVANAAAVAQLAVVEAEQKPFVDALRSGDIDGTFLFSIQRVGNGIAAELTPEEATRVAGMAGVKRVTPLAQLVPDLSSSVPLIGAPAMWTGGRHGEGMRIGIIDTGIDYLHVDLGGPGVYTRTNFTTADVPWNAKVVGGTDLAGDNYDSASSDPAKRVPHPDPDPMDCAGHGTHVAAIAAGLGVKSDGTAYAGPYGSSVDASAFRVGPGVAPAAKLYAIRVFGCSGSTALHVAALEWAVDPNRDGNLSDHLDVVNMSLGAAYGWFFDPTVMTSVDNAVLAGTMVVASAGNNGDLHFITGAPAAATRALSVAASTDAMDTLDSFLVTAPASIAGAKVASPSANFVWAKMPAALTSALAYPPSQQSGCSPFSASNAALIAGKIALLDWTDNDCGSAIRTGNAYSAGALGVIFAHTRPRIDITLAGAKEIPVMLVSKTTGDAIKAALPVTITIDPAVIGNGSGRVVDNTLVDTMASFTSRGPRVGDSLLKPDISAPGVTVFSAAYGTGNRGVSLDGTSMAAPHVTGAAALLRQLHPDWSVEEIKALAMNSATNDLYRNVSQGLPLYAPVTAGSGRINLANAATTDVLAYSVDTPGGVGISFGQVDVNGTLTVERQFRVANKSSSAATVTLSYVPITDVPGVSFSFPGGTSLSVPANGSTVARIRLTADATQLRHRRDPASDNAQGGYSRYWITEASGRIDMLRGSEAIRLPVHAVVRPMSAMSAATTSIDLRPASGSATINLTGSSFSTGTSVPDDWSSLVAPFELHESHTRNATIPAETDLKYVGATSNYKAKSGSIADTVIYFGIATHGPWSSPNQVDTEVRIDLNGDGKSDYVIYNSNIGDFLAQGAPNDALLTAICPLPSGTCSSRWMNDFEATQADTNVFNTDVVRYAVPASKIGLSAGHTAFRYRVLTFDGNFLADSTNWIAFDPAHSLNLFGTLSSGMFFDRATNPLPVSWGAGDSVSAGNGILLLHYFNAAGARAEVVPVVTAGTVKHRPAKH